MNFRHPIPRSGKPIKRSPIKKKARSKAERLRIYGPPGYVEWCKSQPCVACGAVGFSEVAHTKTGGTGRKADWSDTVPLCGTAAYHACWGVVGCHQQLHAIGRRSFELKYDVDLNVAALAIQLRWSGLEDTETT